MIYNLPCKLGCGPLGEALWNSDIDEANRWCHHQAWWMPAFLIWWCAMDTSGPCLTVRILIAELRSRIRSFPLSDVLVSQQFPGSRKKGLFFNHWFIHIEFFFFLAQGWATPWNGFAVACKPLSCSRQALFWSFSQTFPHRSLIANLSYLHEEVCHPFSICVSWSLIGWYGLRENCLKILNVNNSEEMWNFHSHPPPPSSCDLSSKG